MFLILPWDSTTLIELPQYSKEAMRAPTQVDNFLNLPDFLTQQQFQLETRAFKTWLHQAFIAAKKA